MRISVTVWEGSWRTSSASRPPPSPAKLLPQPGIDDLGEGKLRLVAVHDACAGVDIGLHRIRRDEALAEAVNGRARHLVERRVRRLEIAVLFLRETLRQGDAKLGRDLASRERAHEGADPDQQLARRELGEGHGGDGLGRSTACQQHGDTARHDRGLARAGAGLDEEGAVVDRNGGPPGGIVGECLSMNGHHVAFQTRAASPRSAVAAGSFRGR